VRLMIASQASIIPFREFADGRELLELVNRELMFIERNVQPANLVGLRKRISASILRLIRSTEFNPEIVR
jgi:hypothetical protein